jgi:hypothetical protein
MTLDAWIAVAVVALVFGLLAFSRVAPYLVLVGAMVTLLVLGVIEPASALSGFSNPGTITIGVLCVEAIIGIRDLAIIKHAACASPRRPISRGWQSPLVGADRAQRGRDLADRCDRFHLPEPVRNGAEHFT